MHAVELTSKVTTGNFSHYIATIKGLCQRNIDFRLIMGKEVVFKLDNCMDCPHHRVYADPDDWFCDDDEKVVCSMADRNITIACRPHHKRRECEIPDWCPLKQ